MALRALVLAASLRRVTPQGKEEDPNILGRIELETTQVEPVNVRALCFEGLGQQLGETDCTMLDPRTCTEVDSKGRETWDEDKCDTLPKGSPYFMERSTGWNAAVQSVPAGESAFLCLQCCNAIVMKPCTSKNGKRRKCKQDEGVNEYWPFRCQIPPRPTGDAMRNMLLRDFYGYEFRFTRNQGNRAMGVPHYDDKQVVKCALPRMGCQYEYPRGDAYQIARVKMTPETTIDPHPGYGDPRYEIPECCTEKVIQARGIDQCTYDARCMSSQVFERGLQSWINVAEASELMDMPVPSPPGRVKFWEAAEAAVAIDRAICSSNATTTAEEQALCSDLATKQRNVEKARDHEALARLHRDRRDLACSSKANSFEESDDFGWKQKDKYNRTEYKCRLPGSVYRGEGPYGLPDGSGSDRDKLAKRYENPVNARDAYLDGVRSRELESSCNYRDSRDRERGTYFLKGYDLTIYVEEKSSNTYGFWKSVVGCHAETTEVDQLYVDGDISQETPDQSKYFQRIKLRQRYSASYDFTYHDQGLPFIIIGVGVFLFLVSRIVQCVRDEPCPTCGTRLILAGLSELAPYPLDKQQCALCRFYGAEMPDPVLLARMKARSKFVHGRGFCEYITSPPGGRPKGYFGWCRLYLYRCIRATVIMMAYGIYYTLRYIFVLLLILGDALLHFGARCILRRRRGPGPVCLRTFIPREEDIVDEDPPVPTKIYVAEPALRCENSFLALTRPVPEPERRMVTKEQAYVRRQRAERRKKKIVRKRERLQYAMRYLGANSEKDVAQLAKLDSVVAHLDEEIEKAKIAEADDILSVKPDEEAPALMAEETKESPEEEPVLGEVLDEEPSPPKLEPEPEKTPKKFAVASEKGVGAGVALFLQKEQPEFVNGVRVRAPKKKDSDESEKDK